MDKTIKVKVLVLIAGVIIFWEGSHLLKDNIDISFKNRSGSIEYINVTE